MEKINVYIISGLGADERAFQKLQFPAYWQPVHLRWIQPEKNESLSIYAGRLAENIDHEKPFILAGLSFGGLVANEISKIKQPLFTLLLSTMKTGRQMPHLYRFCYGLRLHRLLPYRLFRKGNFMTDWFFGVKNREDKQVLHAILKDTDTVFLKWAVNALLQWRGTPPAGPAVHLHGTKDRLIPIKQPLPDHTAEGAGHLGILTHHSAFSEAIQDVSGRFPG